MASSANMGQSLGSAAESSQRLWTAYEASEERTYGARVYRAVKNDLLAPADGPATGKLSGWVCHQPVLGAWSEMVTQAAGVHADDVAEWCRVWRLLSLLAFLCSCSVNWLI